MPTKEVSDWIMQRRINVGSARDKGRGPMENSAARSWIQKQRDKAKYRSGRKM